MSSSLMKDYFFKPPINQFSLNFLDAELERCYRTSYQEEVRSSSLHRSLLFLPAAHHPFCALARGREMKADVDVLQSVSPKLQLCVNLSLQGRKSQTFLWSCILRPSFMVASPSPLQLLPALGTPALGS